MARKPPRRRCPAYSANGRPMMMATASAVTVSSSCWTRNADARRARPVGPVGEVVEDVTEHGASTGEEPLHEHEHEVEDTARTTPSRLAEDLRLELVADRLQQQVAETAVGHDRADRHERDGRDGGDAQPGHDHRQRQGQLDGVSSRVLE